MNHLDGVFVLPGGETSELDVTLTGPDLHVRRILLGDERGLRRRLHGLITTQAPPAARPRDRLGRAKGGQVGKLR